MSTKDEQRLFDLRYLRAQIDAEIAAPSGENRPKWTRTPKGQRPDCGDHKGLRLAPKPQRTAGLR